MEQDEIIASIPKEEPKQLIIDSQLKFFLKETAKWGKFLSIVGFVLCGIIAVGAIFMMFLGGAISTIMSKMGVMGSMMSGFIGFIYLLMALLYYFPSKYLFDFSVYIKQALLHNDQESLTYAFSRMKSLYRFWGILMIILLSFYAIIILFAVLVGGFAASQLQGV